jgi:hypothetical protein
VSFAKNEDVDKLLQNEDQIFFLQKLNECNVTFFPYNQCVCGKRVELCGKQRKNKN